MKTYKQYLDIIPGLLLAVLIMVVGMTITIVFPIFGTPTYVIIGGIIVGNLFIKGDVWAKGTAFSEKRLLEISVLLLGYSLTIDSFMKVGLRGIILVLVMIIATILFTIWRGKKHNVSSNTGKLMASGNAICGSSAIVAVSDVIDAKDSERSNSIILINLAGTLLMLLLPILGTYLFGSSYEKNGLLIGSIVQSVGQVAGAGSQMGSDVLEIAMLTKIMRVLMLVFVVLYFSRDYAKTKTTEDAKKIKYFPWYIGGFVLMFIIRFVTGDNASLLTNIKSIGSYFELTALAAIGLRLDFRVLIKNGRSLLNYMFEIVVFQIVLSVALIDLLYRFF